LKIINDLIGDDDDDDNKKKQLFDFIFDNIQ